MTTTAALLASLDTITHETVQMLVALENAPDITPRDRSDARVWVLEIRDSAQEFIEWLGVTRLEEPEG